MVGIPAANLMHSVPYKDGTGATALAGLRVLADIPVDVLLGHLLMCENMPRYSGELSSHNGRTCLCTSTFQPSQLLWIAETMQHMECKKASLSCCFCQEDGCSMGSVESKQAFFSDIRSV